MQCVCGGGGVGVSYFVRQFISLNIFKHRAFSRWGKLCKIMLDSKTYGVGRMVVSVNSIFNWNDNLVAIFEGKLSFKHHCTSLFSLLLSR